jgi:hypothetical protein
MPSLDQIIQPMTGKAVTDGWGAILVLSRDALNVALQQNVVQSFHNDTAMAKVYVVAGKAEQAVDRFEASGLVFGKPQLAFGAAALAGNQVEVTLPIVGGSYIASHHPIGAQLTVTGSGSISEAHGKQLRMTGTFTMTVGHVDGQARVILTLGGEGEPMQTNLAGDNAVANRELAALLSAKFQEVGTKKRFTLCRVNCIDYAELSPMECTLHIQKNPEGVAGTPSGGDGAVVILMQLKGMAGNGRIPNDGAPGTALPYYIPNDKAPNGEPLYTTALIVARDMRGTGETIPPQLAECIFFPTTSTHTYWEGETRVPHDLACFAKLVAGEGAYTVEPAQKLLLPGETQQFTLSDWKGQSVTGADWDVLGLDGEDAGSIVAGRYTPPPVDAADPSSQVEVTATVVREGKEYKASAMLFVEYEPRAITPYMGLRIRPERTPIEFSYNAPDATATTWRLVGPEYGELEFSENEATFTPAEHAVAKTLRLAKQKLEASNGGHTSEAFALFSHGQQLYDIAPHHKTFVKKNTLTPLSHDRTFMPEAKRRWRVVTGNGTVDDNGEFTAPADGLPASNVVQCELVHNGVVFASGYSVLDLSEREPRATWDTLAKFWVKVGTDGTTGRVNANGYQQLQITVYVATTLGGENGTPIPLSLSEVRSIRLRLGTQDIPAVFEDYEGIEPGSTKPGEDENDGKAWRTRSAPNSFSRKLYSLLPASEPAAQARANNEIIKKFELHTRKTHLAPDYILACLTKDGGEEIESTDADAGGGTEKGQVAITPVKMDVFTEADYIFPSIAGSPGPVRVDINGEPAGDTETEPPVGGGDWNDYNLNTIDHWQLSLKKGPDESRTLRTAIFLPTSYSTGPAVPPHFSMLAWESETYGEMMGSFTGYVFYPYTVSPPDGVQPPPQDERFDSSLKKIVPSLDDIVPNYPHLLNIDRFVFMLHRRDDLQFVHKDTSPELGLTLDTLKDSITLRLVDSEGDVRHFMFGFAGAANSSPRNRLYCTVR